MSTFEKSAAEPIELSTMDDRVDEVSDSAPPHRSPLHSWLAVLAITLGVFAYTTTEMVPVGLLTSISADLQVTEGMTGLAVTLYGLMAGVLAPILTAATRRLDRRTLLTAVLAIFVVGNICTALAPSYLMLMMSRLVTGFAHGVMWSIAASIAVRLVPKNQSVRAISIVFSGISIAFVLGVPLGTFIGELSHWRFVFAVIAALGAVSLVAVLILLPRMAPTSVLNLSELPALLKIRNLRVALVVTAIIVCAHFAAYTYITPYLQHEVGIAPQWISSLLLLYGTASVVGNFVAGAGAARALRNTLLLAISALSASILLLLVVGESQIAVIGLLILWGFAFPALPLCLQTLVLQSAPQAPEAATSVFICSFNVSIALGALVGGFAVDTSGPTSGMWVGVVLGVAAAVVLAVFHSERKTAAQAV